MTQITIPLTTYSIRSNKPTTRYGSPASIPIKAGTPGYRILARVSLDKVPVDGVITSAILRVYTDRALAGAMPVRALGCTKAWTSSVTWSNQPTVGAVINTVSKTSPAARTAYDIDVTSWAITRSRNGMRIETTSTNTLWVAGSAGPDDKPVLIVDYVVIPDIPGGLTPNGGIVSVPAPILTYAGDEDMTAQRIEYSLDGITANFTTAWLPATSGYFDPATVAGTPVLTPGQTRYWRVTTDGPTGQSAPSGWAFYTYEPLPVVTISAPAPTTIDGSPMLVWATTDQTSFKVDFHQGSTLKDAKVWTNEPDTRDWTPSKPIPVPGATGRFTLQVRDSKSPRVAAVNAPVLVTVTRDFTTTLTGAQTAIQNLAVAFDDPIPVLSGNIAGGISAAEVALFRDGVLVPLWDADGNVFTWAPIAEFFTGTNFAMRDYTADLRHEHEWKVWVRGAGVPEVTGPGVKAKYSTKGAWLVNPRTREQIEILGYNDQPQVEQETEENSILHMPLNGGLVVEPKRRRLTRSTRQGSLEGTVLNTDEMILDGWVAGPSGNKYRLIFGKVNWSVIIGDYSPVETFYPDDCGPDRVLLGLNWWQRLADY